MKDSPDVTDGGVSSDEPVLRGHGDHVEVSQGKDQMTSLSGSAEEFGDVPGLSHAMAEVGIVGLAPFVWRVSVSAKDFDDLFPPWAVADFGRRHAFAYVPVSAPEGGRTAVQGIRAYAALVDGPFRENGETAAEGTTIVEFPVRQDEAGFAANAAVVFLTETFLESDDVRDRIGLGELAADLDETLVSEL